MKSPTTNRRRIILAFLLVAATSPSGLALSGPSSPPQMQSANPGPVHKQLAKLAGSYTTVTRFSAQPSAAPVDSNGTARFSVVLDGRFLLEEDAGIFMGQETKGLKVWGYDNSTKQYISTWMYTGSTGFMSLVGDSKDDGKSVNFMASFNDGSGGKQVFEAAIRWVDETKFVVGLYAKNPDGSRGPTFETTYTPKK